MLEFLDRSDKMITGMTSCGGYFTVLFSSIIGIKEYAEHTVLLLSNGDKICAKVGTISGQTKHN